MHRIAGNFPPARRAAYAISLSHDQRPLVINALRNGGGPGDLPPARPRARRLDLNVVAWPGDRRAGITAGFEAAPFSAELLELC